MKPWIKYTIIFATIIIAPIAVNGFLQIPAFTSIVGSETDWLSFWGGYLSAIISALVAFLILRKQLEQNQIENKNNREHQEKLFIIEQEKLWLKDLRILLAQYIVSFDYSSIEKAADEIIHSKRYKKPTIDFEAMLHKKQQVDASVRLYLSGIEDEEIHKYLLTLEHFNNEYCGLIEDLSWVSYVLYGPKEEGSIKEKTNRYKNLHLSCHDDEHRIWNIVEKHEYRIQFDIKQITEERLITLKDYSPRLIEGVLNGLINYKNEQINKIKK